MTLLSCAAWSVALSGLVRLRTGWRLGRGGEYSVRPLASCMYVHSWKDEGGKQNCRAPHGYRRECRRHRNLQTVGSKPGRFLRIYEETW